LRLKVWFQYGGVAEGVTNIVECSELDFLIQNSSILDGVSFGFAVIYWVCEMLAFQKQENIGYSVNDCCEM